MAAEEKPEDAIEMARMEMEEAVGAFRHELGRVRTGRASTALLEGLHVNYYGARTPLRQLAGLAAPEPRLLVVTPYDKGALHEIEKAIQTFRPAKGLRVDLFAAEPLLANPVAFCFDERGRAGVDRGVRSVTGSDSKHRPRGPQGPRPLQRRERWTR